MTAKTSTTVGVIYVRIAFAMLALATLGLAAQAYFDQAIDLRSLVLLVASALLALLAAAVTQVVRRRAKPVLVAASLGYAAALVGVLLIQLGGEREFYVQIGVAGLLMAGVVMLLWTLFLPRRGRRNPTGFANYYDR